MPQKVVPGVPESFRGFCSFCPPKPAEHELWSIRARVITGICFCLFLAVFRKFDETVAFDKRRRVSFKFRDACIARREISQRRRHFWYQCERRRLHLLLHTSESELFKPRDRYLADLAILRLAKLDRPILTPFVGD